MYRKSYFSNNHCVYNVNYHLVFSTKYRKKLLSDDIQTDLVNIFNSRAIELNINIKAMEIIFDHVHLFINVNPNDNIIKIINNLKGYSSYIIRKKYTYLKKYKALWTPSYFLESIGYIGESVIIKYIENQKL